jgi:ferrochelatase
MECLKDWPIIPEVTMINSFATHPKFIEAFCSIGKRYPLDDYDHILFSFHGLPKRQLERADRSGTCQKAERCCETLNDNNRGCYSAQCYATARAIAAGLELKKEQHSICFQSRLGKDPWIEPYTSDAITAQLKQGTKRILVFCPAFVCDCIETIDEIGVEYAKEFTDGGGEALDLVEGLNDDPAWIEALQHMVLEKVDIKGPTCEQSVLKESLSSNINKSNIFL